MKKYIIDILENGQEVILNFGDEDSRTFDVLVDKHEGNSDIIELGKKHYATAFLVNLNHVHFVRSQKLI